LEGQEHAGIGREGSNQVALKWFKKQKSPQNNTRDLRIKESESEPKRKLNPMPKRSEDRGSGGGGGGGTSGGASADGE
jgi:hypothetical protein